ncbi:MAG: GntG family PLP-dependent aldolase [Gemmatimonadota bacterium]
MIDLRSDTVTRPSAGMRQAIANAEVGDAALGDDPTVDRLERRVAELLGKEAALFFPSGIMANQTAVLVHTRPGTEVVIDRRGHILDWEEAAPAMWAGVLLRPVDTPDGILDAELVGAAIRPTGVPQPETSLVCMENTHNAAGGRIAPLETLRSVHDVAREHSLPVHLDGARLWNASVASGVSLSDYAATADTVMVALSKALGCPIGSMLAGTADTMARARRVRRRLGGSMRQVGILAAAGLYALDHHLHRIVDDHGRARSLAERIAGLDGVSVVMPETNIVMVDILRHDTDGPTVVDELARHGVLLSVFGPRRVRAVTHLDVDDEGVQSAARAFAEVMNG